MKQRLKNAIAFFVARHTRVYRAIVVALLGLILWRVEALVQSADEAYSVAYDARDYALSAADDARRSADSAREAVDILNETRWR